MDSVIMICRFTRLLRKDTNDLRFVRTLFQGIVLKQNVSVDQKQSSDIKISSNDGESDLYVNEADEEELMKKRNKNRLPERIYRRFVKKEALPIEMKYEFKLNSLRRYYARHGSASKLNPGILWPTREELKDIMEYDKMFRPPLKETMEKIAAEKAKLQEEYQEYEEEVDSNMSKLDKWVEEYYARIAKKEAAATAAKQKRSALIDEISDYLGYDVDPADPKFKEAVEQKEKEAKKALKEKKQKESYAKMIQKLTEIAKQSDS